MSHSAREGDPPTADWFEAMRRGDFAAAWRSSDRILAQHVAIGRRWDLPRHEQWVWDGSPLVDRTVLVRCYHGLGDTIQFARFLPLLSQLARQTIVWAQPWLVPLLRTLPDIGRVLPLNDGTPEVDYDVDIEIMELAHALRITPDSLPGRVPYFEVPLRARLSPRCSLGVVADSGDWDPRRSVPSRQLAEAVRHGQWDAYSLQLGPPVPGLEDAGQKDVLALASRLETLDLVISADTMMAHLAGALGVRTWTLLPFDADWRWMSNDRFDTPWYPTMRLIRQTQPGNWQSVLDDVSARLQCER